MSAAATRSARRQRSRGQSLVEFSLIVPVFLLVLFGMMEFGFIFTHDLTLEYATREGARAGAALASGGGLFVTNPGTATNCPSGTYPQVSPNWQTVDPLVIAAVERVLESPGSQVVVARVSQIVIYQAKSDGTPVSGTSDVWTYRAGAGPTPQGTTDTLDFVDASYPNGDAWPACARSNSAPNIQAIGVSLTYTYQFVTPLASIMGFFGGGTPTLGLTDRTVMALEPTAQ